MAQTWPWVLEKSECENGRIKMSAISAWLDTVLLSWILSVDICVEINSVPAPFPPNCLI